MIEQQYLDDMVLQLKKLKGQAEKSIAQIDDDQLFAVLDPEANSIAIIMKHVAGNMRSRWTDFLTSDGEKPDRNRDGEFLVRGEETRTQIMDAWEDGWARTIGAISALTPGDLSRSGPRSRRRPYCPRSDQSAGGPLRGPCRADRAARQALRGIGLADLEHSSR